MSEPCSLRATTYYAGDVPEEVTQAVGRSYVEIFGEAPWCETWSLEAAVKKLCDEISDRHSFLSVLWSEEDRRAVGFCWGSVIERDKVPSRVHRARPRGDMAALAELVAQIETKVIFVDEIAKLRSYRNLGIESVLRLVWPVVLAVARERVGVLCWSGNGSRIISILTGYFDFEELGTLGDIGFWHMPVRRGVLVADRLTAEFSTLVGQQ
jgi:hypothetical protein